MRAALPKPFEEEFPVFSTATVAPSKAPKLNFMEMFKAKADKDARDAAAEAAAVAAAVRVYKCGNIVLREIDYTPPVEESETKTPDINVYLTRVRARHAAEARRRRRVFDSCSEEEAESEEEPPEEEDDGYSGHSGDNEEAGEVYDPDAFDRHH